MRALECSSLAFALTLAGCGAPDITGTLWRCASHSDCGEGWACNVADSVCEPASEGVDGVYPDRVVLGMSAAISTGPVEMGLAMKAGIDAYVAHVNRLGGVGRRRLEIKAMDDGYEPARALANMEQMVGNREVFAVLGSIGTPTAEVAAPYSVSQRTLYFGGVSGASILRKDPPDRYVFNFRASYKQETEKAVNYFAAVKEPGVSPLNMGVFAQGQNSQGVFDAYGQAGYEGVVAAVRSRVEVDASAIQYATYERGTSDITPAVRSFLKWLASGQRGKSASGQINAAILMVATPEPAVLFTKDFIRELNLVRKGGTPNPEYGLSEGEVAELRLVGEVLFSMVSFGGNLQFAEQLRGLGTYRDMNEVDRRYCEGILVTQVVPHFESSATGVLQFRDHLSAHVPSARPSFLALEGYLVARLFVSGLEAQGRGLTVETFVSTLESMDQINLGIGSQLGFSQNRHQALDKVWGTILDASCNYTSVDLDL